ncbi:pectinesterase family protein [Myceligenerans indicum]|uniref:Pectin esterase n=1 Tax=Myceligenerans indicum TaxID=2593663 RepID=A0ABS1LQJ9_9MICO|nr:pectinesterase family protein [Myceligenerans indicum]MBL0888443.1 hypothetical protein [Myceligenerans indicum]
MTHRPRGGLAATLTVVAVLAATLSITAIPTARADTPTAGDTYTLTAGHTGMCLDVPGASDEPGTVLQQWGCTDGASWEQFRLVDAGSGAFEIVNAGNELCLDVTGGSTAIGAEVLQWPCKGSAWQHWTLSPAAGGAYQVVNVNSGLCLTVQDGSTSSGARTVQGQCTTADDKRWSLDRVGSSDGGDYTVASDGTGTYTTVQAAVDAVPSGNTEAVTITIKPGTYREKVTVPSNKPYISLIGGGSEDTVIVGNVSAGQAGSHRGSATVVVEGHDFFADNLTIENDYDEAANGRSQALALYLNADRAVLDDLRLLGDQDTFLVNNNARAYVSDTYIEGTVDFIYGGGIAVFHRCSIYEKRSTGGPITAASTPAENPYGFLFYRSRISGATDDSTQLGRPWRQGAQVVYRESELSATIETAQPWTDMGDATWQDARYFEYANTGPGATVNGNRPQLTAAQAANYTPERYLAGGDGWDPIDRSGSAWPQEPDGFAALDGGTTGGAGGQTVTVTTYDDLDRYATASEPYVIRVAGAISVEPFGHEIRVGSDKTIVGVGTSGEIVGGGFFLGEGTSNVILRNLTIRDTQMADDDPDDKLYDYDGIQLDTADHVWIDHNRITRMNDGLIDSRKDTTNLTVSWNVLEEGNKAFGIGWTDNVTARMTIHHNIIRDTNQRNPSIDNVARAHLYNNLLQDITSYGNLSRGSARVVIENSYYDTVHDPFYRNADTASLSQSGSILVNTTGRAETGGTTFTPSDYYTYTLDPAADVPAILSANAGPQPSIG